MQVLVEIKIHQAGCFSETALRNRRVFVLLGMSWKENCQSFAFG
jgi:hypothetical protein